MRNEKFKDKNSERYAWLQDIKDANGNPQVDSPEYDPRTLFIPQSAWNKFTPFEKQFWEVKSKNWDCVVFFKKGKFYELYENDADIGHRDYDLKMVDRVNMRMVGVPETSFSYWAAQFVAKGHKVAKVDQMETAIGKTMRERDNSAKVDKVVRRELSSILTAGTLVDTSLLTSDMGTYCMAIKEEVSTETTLPLFGICFVDTSTAEFNLAFFQDDINRTLLETLLIQVNPKEIIIEKGYLSAKTERLIKNTLDTPIWNKLTPGSEFWSAERTQDEVRIGCYFNQDIEMDTFETWPRDLVSAFEHPILLSAFGALVWYLQSLKLDKDIVSAKRIYKYDPIRSSNSLVLDGQTLANLEVFQNTHDSSSEGTLVKLLDNTATPFGKRLFQRWLCHPLLKIHEINARLDAVEDLMRGRDVQDYISKRLNTLPDLERLIARIHARGCKVKEFLSTLEGFQKARDMIVELKEQHGVFSSQVINQLLSNFPSLDEPLEYFKSAFVMEEVDIDYQKSMVMVPNQGFDAEWDTIQENIQGLVGEFDRYLTTMKKELKCAKLVYKDMGKDLYQIEVPKEVKVPREWIQMSSTAKVNRYWSNTIKSMVTQYKEHLETKNAYVKTFSTVIYQAFDEHYKHWLLAVQILAEIDALVSLSKGSSRLGEPACRPQFLDQEESVAEFDELRHPCVIPGDFVPNNVHLGKDSATMIILTGPNMGGKSTLLRQTCIAVIMAQLGCYVPARSATLTPCDRIYTRIGANDNIMAGQSTFMVELSETAKILKNATSHSMVILDELGRGTSTHDGYAIAYAVLHELITHIGCLGIFATHYQNLCYEFINNTGVHNMHM
ncbi:muts domain V-domain-containing protein [Spinellus fusiger]|nr:muts domain V-domain-containing protein [Spinellus fusiger]